MQPPKDKNLETFTFFKKFKKQKFSVTRLEICFFFIIESRAELNIINTPTWNDIQTLHPKLSPLKTSSKLATAHGSSLTKYGKIQLILVPTQKWNKANY